MKKKRLFTGILIGLVAVALVTFLYLSRSGEARYRLGIRLGLVASDASIKDYQDAPPSRRADAVERLIADGFDINAKDRYGRTLLLMAAKSGHTDVVEFLISKGADVDATCGSWWMQGARWREGQSWIPGTLGQAPLHVAVGRYDRQMAELLLANGADPDVPMSIPPYVRSREANGCAPLHLAYLADMAQLLIANGANVNARDESGETPLHRLIGLEDLAELLIAEGADINAKDNDGVTVLDAAVMTNVAELLIVKGAAATIHSTAFRGELTRLEALIEEGADVNAKGAFGLAPLHLAAFGGHMRLVELLLANGALVDMEGETKRIMSRGVMRLTPLHMAALTGHQDVAELLINQGADINAKSGSGWAPLPLATNNGHKQLVEFLLENGADANSTAPRLPRFLDNFSWDEDRGRGVWLSMELNAGRARSVEGALPRALAEQLVFKGPVGKIGNWPVSPLWIAKGTGNAEIAALLEEHGGLELSLHQVAAEGNTEQVQLHISQGSDVNAKDGRNRTPLYHAKRNGQREAADLLVQHGATEYTAF